MDKLVIRRKKPVYTGDYTTPVRLRLRTHEQIEKIVEETGMLKVDVIAKLVDFAYERIELVDWDFEEGKDK